MKAKRKKAPVFAANSTPRLENVSVRSDDTGRQHSIQSLAKAAEELARSIGIIAKLAESAPAIFISDSSGLTLTNCQIATK